MHVALRRWLFLITLGVAGAACIRVFLLEAIWVASDSMAPTLYVGTHYLVNKCLYRIRAPQRGDIISFQDPLEPEIGEIKRVIAVPGDTIEIKDKKVILNGTPLEEPYTIYKRAGEKLQGDNIGPVTVPSDHVFVLGDNRDMSMDSSYWRDPNTHSLIYFLPYAKIKGKLIVP